MHASPPCQQLSLLNARRNEDDGLDMVRWTIRFCKQSCFDSYTIEQVNNPRVRLLYQERKVPFIICDFSKLGVCQSRRRLIASNHLQLLSTLQNLTIPFEPFHKIFGKRVQFMSQTFNSKEIKRKYDKIQPFYTIISQLNNYHVYTNKEMYRVTIPVACKLQGFSSDYFTMVTTKKDICQMIGNAIPTQVGFVITKLLLQL